MWYEIHEHTHTQIINGYRKWDTMYTMYYKLIKRIRM